MAKSTKPALYRRRNGGQVTPTAAGVKKIIQWAGEGTSKELVAYRLGIPPEDFEATLKRHENTARAYQQGLAEHEQLLIEALTAQAIGDDETRGVTQAAKELLEKVHGKKPDETSNVTIILPDALALDDFLKRTTVIEHKENDT